MRRLAAAVGTLACGMLTALPALAADAAKGQAIFEDRCTFCHAPEGAGQGPNLTGVVGRKAGTATGFPYTEAMKRSGIVWSPANLDTFLAGPSKLVPGTAMAVVLPDAAERNDLIAYLGGLSEKR